MADISQPGSVMALPGGYVAVAGREGVSIYRGQPPQVLASFAVARGIAMWSRTIQTVTIHALVWHEKETR